MKNKSHKTMTLKAAYGQASPVPLKADESISTDRSREVRHYISTGGETTFPKARSIAKITGGAYCQPKGDMAKFYKPEVVATNRVNAALLAHSFNVLPEVVAALQTIADAGEHEGASIAIYELKAIARHALVRINAVRIP